MRKRVFLTFFLVLFLSLTLAGAETLVVARPTVLPDTADNRTLAEAVAQKAALLAERSYGQYVHVLYGAEADKTAYRVDITAVLQEGSAVLTATLRAGAEPSFAIPGPLRPEHAPYLANALFFLWSSLHGYLAERMEAAPELVDELPAEAILRSALPEMPAMLAPTSAAVSGSGSLLVGFSMICVELDPAFRLLGSPGRSLYEEGNYTYAFGVAATPAGSLFFKPGMGRELFRLSPGGEQPQRWRLASDVFGPFAALPDASVVVLDIQKRQAYRVMERKTQSLNLFTGPYSYISAMAVGPEGTLWVYDAQERRLRIHGSDGRLIDSVMPLLDPAKGASPTAMAVRADGSFLLYCTPGELWAFSRLGVPLWRLAALPGWEGVEESLPQAAALAADSRQGLIWLTDQTGRRIVKLLDSAYCRRQRIGNPQEQKILELNLQQRRSPNDPRPTAQKALLYEQAGSFEMARQLWQRVLEIDPGNAQGQERLRALELSILASGARSLRDRTLQTLDTVGPETARLSYGRAVQLYERILAMDPLNEAVRAEMRELKERFQAREAAARAAPPSLAITRVQLANLFPSLLQHYRRYPAARIEVQNTSGGELEALKASILIRRFMDFPTESAEIPRLGPGQKAELALPVLLSTAALELEEDLSVQASLEVTGRSGTQSFSLARFAALTVYRRTALAWDDSGKLASFITPNDGAVTRFAHRAAGAAGSGASSGEASGLRLAQRLERAARICDALGAYGIEYIEDPDSPISKVLGKEQVVDTVRLPRTTLLNKAGDCDDSTALLGSLLESAGVGTAIMTSPGHVFLAFDTGVPADNAWLYAGGEIEAIARDGSLWIPVETTALRKGFVAAWGEASRLFREHAAAGRIEFLPLAGLRERYPPIPLTESPYELIEPAPAEIDALYRSTLSGLQASLYEAKLGELTRDASSAEARRRGKALNRLGILHANFGRDREAEKAFLECAERDSLAVAPLLNLANLRLARGETAAAREALQRALKRKSDSVAVNLLLAQVYHQERDGRKAAEHFRMVQSKDPSLAARYSYLADASSGSAQARAGTGERSALPWSED